MWLPNRIPMWSELMNKVGMLPTEQVLKVVEFFGCRSSVNELVVLRDKLPELAAHYAAALESIQTMAAA